MYKCIRFRVAILFASFLLFGQIHAQEPAFHHYGTQYGLPNMYVYGLIQDRQGYIWACTQTGVARFDGYAFETFTVQDGLADNEVFGAFEDSFGRIWFRSYNGQPSYFDSSGFHSPSNNKMLAEGLASGFITSFVEDPDRAIWMGSFRSEVVVFHPDSTVSRTLAPVTDYNQTSKPFVLWPEGNQVYLMSAFGAHNLTSNTFYASGFESNPTIFGAPASIGGAYAGRRHVLVHFDGQLERAVVELPVGEEIISVFEDRDAGLWLGTYSGVWHVEQKTGRLEKILNGKPVSGTMQDRTGGYWFSTLGQGIYHLTNPAIKHYTTANGMDDPEVFCIYRDSSGKLLVGGNNQTYYNVEPKGKLQPTSLPIMHKSGRKRVWGFYESGDGRKWIYGDSFVGYMQNGQWHPWYEWSARCLLELDGRLFYAAGSGTFATDQYEGPAHVRLQGTDWSIGHIISAGSFDLQPIGRGKLIAATQSGLVQIDTRAETISRLFPNCTQCQDRILALTMTSDSTIWAASSNHGLIGVRGNQYMVINSDNGLSSNICTDVQAVGQLLWVATNNGLNKIEYDWQGTAKIEVFDDRDGLISNNLNCLLAEQDTIWLGSEKGLTVFVESAARLEAFDPPVYITNLQVNGNEVRPGSALHLEPNENDIALQFVGLDFESRGQVQYRYRLLGSDSAWRRTNNRQVELPELTPGSYHFEVQASNAAGEWGESASVEFDIEAPLWQRWWFIVAVQLMLLGIIWFAYRINLRNVRRKNELEQRAMESKHEALRAQMNPHFIFNALNTIQRFVISGEKEKAYRFLERFGALMRNTLEHSRHSFVTLTEDLELLQLYLQLEAQRFDGKFDFQFHVDNKLEPNRLLIPPMLIQPYVENAIRHGVRPLKTRGNIQVHVQKNGNGLLCVVQDNGIGREESAANQRKSIHKRTSLGMNITSERVHMLNKGKNGPYKVVVIDLKNEAGKAIGTRVELHFPMIEKY